MKKLTLLLAVLVISNLGLAQENEKKAKKCKKDHVVTIATDFGEMKLILYRETPKHKANFVKLASEGYYNGTTFHRIIEDFMIQGGDPNSKNDNPNDDGSGGPGYRVDAEFNKNLYHKKGALAAARTSSNNPKKASSGCQFYIVQGKKYSRTELERMQNARTGVLFSEQQMKDYEELGGTPFLDMGYTVFGELISGMEVLDKIAVQPKNSRDRPNQDIKMTVTVELVKCKKIAKLYNYSCRP